MDKNNIKVGTELVINGVWAIVDAIDGDELFCLDAEGGEITILKKNVDIIL